MLVTAVMPTFDGERFVRRAIDSVLAQDYRELELVVVDDGSTDATVRVVQEYEDPRLRLVRRANGGVAAARNTGVEHAAGSVVAFIDQDDEWLPHKLSAQLPRLCEPGVAMVGCLMRYVNAHGRALGVAGEPTDGRDTDIATASFVPFPMSAALAWRDLVLAAGGFDERLVQQVAPVDDLDLMSRLVGHGRIVTVPEILGGYRVHSAAGSVHKYFAMQAGTEFVAARVRARKAGTELTWEEFGATYRRSLSRRRAEYVRYWYRTAGVSIASGRKIAGGAYLAAAATFGPQYTANRLRRQRARS